MWSNSELGYDDGGEELRHYGVKGMKWKKRAAKSDVKDAASIAASQAKNYAAYKTGQQSKAAYAVKTGVNKARAAGLKGKVKTQVAAAKVEKSARKMGSQAASTAKNVATKVVKASPTYQVITNANKIKDAAQHEVTRAKIVGEQKAKAAAKTVKAKAYREGTKAKIRAKSAARELKRNVKEKIASRR